MKKLFTHLILSGCMFVSSTSLAATFRCASDNGIKLPAGFCASVFADDLGTARHLVVNGNGDVYVALQSAHDRGAVAALRDTDGDGRADVVKYFGAANETTGIAIHNGYLYFATPTQVLRYRLQPDQLVPQTPPELVVGGFPEQDQHAAKSITFDAAGHLYVNVGAPSNSCQQDDRLPGSPGVRPCLLLEHHGGIWQFDADRAGQDFIRDGKRYATGVRNAVAITWHEGLFAVQMGRDQLHENWPKFYDAEQGSELPAEEFLLIKPGDDFGWPYCYYDQRRKQRVLEPEYGGDSRIRGDCAKYPAPIAAFPGHWAPESVLFYTSRQFPTAWRHGAFIAFHGSWNRTPVQAGYKVVFVPFHDDAPAGNFRIFADGFAGPEKLTSPRIARYRPMGLAQAPDGALYISDSQQGRIWRIVHKN